MTRKKSCLVFITITDVCWDVGSAGVDRNFWIAERLLEFQLYLGRVISLLPQACGAS